MQKYKWNHLALMEAENKIYFGKHCIGYGPFWLVDLKQNSTNNVKIYNDD